MKVKGQKKCCKCDEQAVERSFDGTGWCEKHFLSWKSFCRQHRGEFFGLSDAFGAWFREEGSRGGGRKMKVPEQICLFCEHFKFYSGSYGWSDVTPGYDAEIYCIKKHWAVDLYEDSREKYRAKMLTAKLCEDYRQVELENV